MKIKTKRLILRPQKLSDLKDIVEGAGDIKVAIMTASIPHPYKKKDALEWIKRNIRNWKKLKKEGYSWVIELKEEKKVIGATGIFKIDKFNRHAETGSWVNSKYWRKGLITEAKIPILNFAFNKLKLRKLVSVPFVENKASIAMSKKLGYKLEGRMKKHDKCLATGKIHDQFIYSLFNEDWKKARKKLLK